MFKLGRIVVLSAAFITLFFPGKRRVIAIEVVNEKGILLQSLNRHMRRTELGNLATMSLGSNFDKVKKFCAFVIGNLYKDLSNKGWWLEQESEYAYKVQVCCGVEPSYTNNLRYRS